MSNCNPCGDSEEQNCNSCNPCPPTEKIDPDLCEPPPNTANPQQLFAIDGNGCPRLIPVPVGAMPILTWDDATSRIKFVTGDIAGANPWDVSEINEQLVSFGLLSKNNSNQANVILPDYDNETGPWVLYSNLEGNGIYFIPFADVIDDFFNTCGLLARDCDTDEFYSVTGTADQYLGWEGDGTPIAKDFPAAAGEHFFGIEGLRARRVSGSTVEVNFNAIAVVNGTNIPERLLNGMVTANILSGGVNGLDTGSVNADTWYYMYVIWDGVNTSGLWSLSATSPSLPTGYTHWKLVTAARTNDLNNLPTVFRLYDQIENKVTYYDIDARTVAAFSYDQDDSDFYNATGDVDISTCVPPSAAIVTCSYQFTYTPDASSGAATHNFYLGSTDETVPEPLVFQAIGAATSAIVSFGGSETRNDPYKRWEFPIIDTQTLYSRVNSTSNPPIIPVQNFVVDIYVHSYVFNVT